MLKLFVGGGGNFHSRETDASIRIFGLKGGGVGLTAPIAMAFGFI